MAPSLTVRRVLGVTFVVAALMPRAYAANQLCNFSFSACPDNFNGDTIVVPENVVALTPNIYACRPTWVVEGAQDTSKPPSIVFVIDNSGSMFRGDPGVAPHDQWGSRFMVFHQLLDSLRAMEPRTEVSVIVFQERLFFDVTTGQYFTRYFKTLPTVTDGVTQQAYLQFMRLDSVYANGKTGMQVIEDVLMSDTGTVMGPNGAVTADTLVYKPAFTLQPSTNINVAFRAARTVLATAANPKDRQYVIFFSDGLPCCTDTADGLPAYNFQKGQGLPTTFTVFFTNPGGSVPASIDTMTRNIQNNGYSLTNPKSAYWGITTSHDALLSLLVNNVMSTMLNVKSATPTSLTVNGIQATSLSDSQFVFTAQFPLLQNLTEFKFTVHYTYTLVVAGKPTGSPKDTTVYLDFWVRRMNPGTTPAGVTVTDCWPGSTLDLYYNGQVVTAVNDTMTNLQVRVVPGGSTAPTAPSVVVQSKTGGDNESFALTNAGTYWTVTFQRAIGTAAANDKTLQTAATDSIIVIYRNPAVPLDTVRKAYPFTISRAVTINSAAYFDRNADGYIDSIFVGISGTLKAADLTTIAQWTDLPANRNFAANPTYKLVTGGYAIVVDQSRASPPSTGVTVDDRMLLTGGMLPGGGQVNPATIMIADKMAPVIVRATGAVNPGGRDTVVIYFSEPVGQITASQPFLFSHAGGAGYTQDLTLAAVHADGGYVFLAAGTGTLKSGDSIWINPAAQVGDTLKAVNKQTNPANRRVLLPISISRMITVQSASYFDRNADGYIDSIFVGISGNMIAEDLPFIKQAAALPAARGFTNAVWTMVSGGAAIILDESKAAAPRTSVSAADKMIVAATPLSTGGWLSDAVIAIADKVAPVILRASATVNPAAKDTLVVYLSEPVNAISSTQPFSFAHAGGAVYTQTLTAVSVRSDGGYVFVVTTPSAMQKGDTVWINPAGQVGDVVNNKQANAANRRAPIDVRVMQVVTPRSAAYFDRNADGYIDSIFVAVDGSLTAEDLYVLKQGIVLPPDRGFSNPVFSLTTGGISIVVDQNQSAPPRTGVTAGDTLAIHAAILPSDAWVGDATLPIADKVAPVILQASVASNDAGQDSITVIFSEAVNGIPAGRPFLYINADNAGYTEQLAAGRKVSDSIYVFAVTDTSHLRRGDRIWINPQAAVVGDGAGNIQTNPANRKVLIQILSVPFDVVVRAVNNPFVPGASSVPIKIQQLTHSGSDGLVLMVKPSKAPRPDVQLDGWASIYDVVKNPIVLRQPMSCDAITHNLYFVWDGRNSKGRAVATGTYLALFSIDDHQGLAKQMTERIGVKR